MEEGVFDQFMTGRLLLFRKGNLCQVILALVGIGRDRVGTLRRLLCFRIIRAIRIF